MITCSNFYSNNLYINGRSVLKIKLTKIQVLWDVALCGWVQSSWHLEGMQCLPNNGNYVPNNAM